MPLKVTDTSWSLLRPTDVHSRLSRMTEVSYNNAVLMKPFSSVAADDLPYIRDTTLRVSGAAVGDYVGYTYTIGAKDTVPTTERLYFSWNYRFLDAVAPASKLFVTMRPPAVVEVHAPSDKVSLAISTVYRSSSAGSDVVRSQFSALAPDAVPVGSFQTFGFIGAMSSVMAASTDRLFYTLSVAVKDTATTADKVLSTIAVLLRDSVTASSSFLLGGQSFLDTASAGFSSDAFYSTLVAKSPDTAATSDSVVIGIRYLIEAYFGGLAIGGSPFGGRL